MSTLTFLYNENFIEACNFIKFQVCFPYFADWHGKNIYSDLTLGETLVLSNVSCYYQPFYSI